ncbi:MAG: VOC family protein [Melioribacteraceae bacterium]|nr:VOC family protein [Melioribacteraceae bacterium]
MDNIIVPCLWFDNNAEEAVNFYTSVFHNSRIENIIRYTKAGFEIHQMQENSIMTISFELLGKKFLALNGGPIFKFNEAVSFFVYCESNEEIERLYNIFSKEGSILMPLDKYDWSSKYAWVKDKYGVSWQLDIDKINSEQKILPTLLFANQKFSKVKEAADFYTSIFPNSKTIFEYPFPKSEDLQEGTLLFAQLKLNDYLINVMSGGTVEHKFDFNEAISLIIYCNNQKEIDYYWQKLTDGGQEVQCGWLKDKYGVSWQVVPKVLNELLLDETKKEKVTKAYLQMKKFEIDKLKEI